MKKSKLFNIAWKVVVNHDFWIFWPPLPKKNHDPKFFLVIWKNQSCSKLPEMTRKLVENKFWNCRKLKSSDQLRFLDILAPPPKKNHDPNFFLGHMKKSKLLKIAWNGEKIGRKQILKFFGTPTLKKITTLNFCGSHEKIKVDQNCMKWRENWSKFFFEFFWDPRPKKKSWP